MSKKQTDTILNGTNATPPRGLNGPKKEKAV